MFAVIEVGTHVNDMGTHLNGMGTHVDDIGTHDNGGTLPKGYLLAVGSQAILYANKAVPEWPIWG